MITTDTDRKPASQSSLAIDREIYLRVMESDLLQVFAKHHNSDVNPHYLDRADRNRFAAAQLNQEQFANLLNLGGGGARHLAASIGERGAKVYEVDMQGDCDLKVNLDAIKELPFESQSFDVVCAFDVLEHLENFHLVNEEMIRVAKDFVLVSLPNSAAEIFYDPFRNRQLAGHNTDGGVYSKFYGLPLCPPGDRHRWWIYFLDIVRYYFYLSEKYRLRLEFWVPTPTLAKRLFKAVFGSHLYYTFFCPHVWVKLSKRP